MIGEGISAKQIDNKKNVTKGNGEDYMISMLEGSWYR
jgi:hypothetical protein